MANEALQVQAQASIRAAPTPAEKKIAEKKGGKNSPRGPQLPGTGTGTAMEGLDERLALSVVEAIVEFSGENALIHLALLPPLLINPNRPPRRPFLHHSLALLCPTYSDFFQRRKGTTKKPSRWR